MDVQLCATKSGPRSFSQEWKKCNTSEGDSPFSLGKRSAVPMNDPENTNPSLAIFYL